MFSIKERKNKGDTEWHQSNCSLLWHKDILPESATTMVFIHKCTEGETELYIYETSVEPEEHKHTHKHISPSRPHVPAAPSFS